MKSKLNLIPTLSVNPNSICIYNQISWEEGRPSRDTSAFIDPATGKKYSHLLESTRSAEGLVSKTAEKKINRSIDYLLCQSIKKTAHFNYQGRTFNFKISFITLTLPSKQVHDDNYIKSNYLNQFLTEAKKRKGLGEYVWRAEKQKNGNIHFHILCDKFIEWLWIRDSWNRIVNKDKYHDRYQERNGNKQANSTDVHAIKNVKNIKSYVSKYLSKNEKECFDEEGKLLEHMKVKGRIWGCSENLSKCKGMKLEIDNELGDELKKITSDERIRKFEDTYFTVYYVNLEDLINIKATAILSYFRSYLESIFEKTISLI